MKKIFIGTLISLAAAFLGGCFKDGVNGVNGANGSNGDSTMTWTVRTDGVGDFFKDAYYHPPLIVWGNNQFVIVKQGMTLTSADGKSWVRHTSNLTGNIDTYLNALVWGANTFIVLKGYSPYASPDGITWSPITIASGSFAGITSIVRASDKFVAGGSSTDTNYAFTSTDGVSWATYAINKVSSGGLPASISWANGKYLATTSYDSLLSTSSDGVHWTNSRNVEGVSIASMVYGANRYLGINTNISASPRGSIFSSIDGISWSYYMYPGLSAIAWDGSRFVVASYGQTLFSSDGVTWTAQTIGLSSQPNSPNQMAVGNHTIVALGGGGILTCPAP